MAQIDPVIEMNAADPSFEESGFAGVCFDLRVMPGDFVLVESRDNARSDMFADMCCGMVPLNSGNIRCMGLDWTSLPDRQANALRGRIARVGGNESWIDLYATDMNILLAQLHHTTRSEDVLMEEALQLAQKFGLPGLPMLKPSALPANDLARCACVRAFMGKPSLLLLQNPIDGLIAELQEAFLDEVTRARARGAAVIMFVRRATLWRAYLPFVSSRLRLVDEGLFAHEGAGNV